MSERYLNWFEDVEKEILQYFPGNAGSATGTSSSFNDVVGLLPAFPTLDDFSDFAASNESKIYLGHDDRKTILKREHSPYTGLSPSPAPSLFADVSLDSYGGSSLTHPAKPIPSVPENLTRISRSLCKPNRDIRQHTSLSPPIAGAIIKKGRGRPRLNNSSSSADRRRAQIREAQKTYREKKEQALSSLHDRVEFLENTIAQMQSASLDICKAGLQLAMQTEYTGYINVLTDSARKLFTIAPPATDQIRSELTNLTTTLSSLGSSDYYIGQAEKFDSQFFPTSNELVENNQKPLVLRFIDIMSCKVDSWPGEDRYSKLVEALLRVGLTFSCLILISGNRDIINRKFPDGIPDAKVKFICLSRRLMSTDAIGPESQKKAVVDSYGVNYPSYFNAWQVSEMVKSIETSAGSQCVDLDKLVSWLCGRGLCLGKTARYTAHDIETALRVAQEN
ncbi:uncharacterized protein V1516DRAFT_679178 [Lipomyces oligophaga]|uniref:uncharacterized protein n=1 Tax=Lipomyces oligophaga TaxID=45792 RepID=UPI0034CF3139